MPFDLPPHPGLHPALDDPWEIARSQPEGAVLAVLTATHGPAYRDAGAALAILSDGRFAGAITAGCIEADLMARAREVRATGRAQRLRYGEGSPFLDLRLPCGGAIEIALFLLHDADCLDALSAARRARRPVALTLDEHHRLSLGPWRQTGRNEADFIRGFRPPLRFAIFGAGPEATVFADLVRSLRMDHLLFSHDDATLEVADALGCRTRQVRSPGSWDEAEIDQETAGVLFYHDHDHETDILRRLLQTPAFYIGAQGSRRTQLRRMERLEALGVEAAVLERVRGPIGLIPSSREPRSLAVSVLAEILERSKDLHPPAFPGNDSAPAYIPHPVPAT